MFIIDNWLIIFLFLPGYIDLSKRRVSQEEIAKCEEKFAKAKAVSSIWFTLQINVALDKLNYFPNKMYNCYKCCLLLSLVIPGRNNGIFPVNGDE